MSKNQSSGAEVHEAILTDLLEKLMEDYVPKSLLHDFTIKKTEYSSGRFVSCLPFLQELLDKSNNQFRMYGSGDELAENLNIYKNIDLFKKKLKLWEKRREGASVTEPVKRRTLKGSACYEKHEFVEHICESIKLRYTLTASKKPPPDLQEYLKSLMTRFNGCYEFVRYDKDVFKEISNRIMKCSSSDTEEGLPIIKKPFSFMTRESLKQHYDLMNEELDSRDDFKILQELVSKHSDFFLPYSDAKIFKNPKIVRIFEDGDQKFVMETEIFRNSRIENPNEKPQKPGVVHIMDLDEVFKTFRDQVKDIEFIRCPIKRAKHAAVPIVTSSGDHCILASDALFQILRHLISGLQVFQTADINLISEFISLLDQTFPADSKFKFLISTQVLDDFKQAADNIWIQNEPVQVESIEHFNFDDLMKELKHLGLDTVLPEIIDHVEDVYMEVCLSKKRKELRTCDMIDAIEICQMICVLDRYPKLKEFIHSQRACNQIPLLLCETCPISTGDGQKKYKKSLWKEYEELDVTVKVEDERKEIGWHMKIYETGVSLFSNESLLTSNELLESSTINFLLDDDDCDWLQNLKQTSRVRRLYLGNIGQFTKNRPKMIYIRSIPFEDSYRVLTMEVLEVIPVLLKQQNTPMDQRLLNRYTKLWKSANKSLYNSIDLVELRRVLESFDIDKGQITIVPNPVYLLKTVEMTEQKLGVASLISPNGKTVMDTSQAIFSLFQSVVCSINWNKGYCKTHVGCLDELKVLVIRTMKEYADMKKVAKRPGCETLRYLQGTYVADVDTKINSILEHCTMKIAKKLYKETIDYPGCFVWQQMFYETYRNSAKSFGIPVYSNPRKGSSSMSVWMYRLLFMKGHLETFFDQSGSAGLRDIIRDAMLDKVPDIPACFNIEQDGPDVAERLFELIKHSEAKESAEVKEGQIENPVEPEIMDHGNSSVLSSSEFLKLKIKTLEFKAKEKDLKIEELQKKLEHRSESKKELEVMEQKLKEQHLEISKKDKIIVEAEEEFSKRITSLQNRAEEIVMSRELSEKARMAEMRDELQQIFDKLKEDDAKSNKKIEELVAENTKMKKSNEELEKKLKKSASKSSDEIKKLRAAKEASEVQMKKTNKGLTESIQVLEQKVSDLEEKSDADHLEMAMKQSSLEDELKEKERVILDLQKSRTQQTAEQDKAKEDFQNKISLFINQQKQQLDTFFNELVPSTPQDSALLISLQKTRDKLRDDSPLKLAKEMVEKLISLSSRPEIHQMACYEYEQYEGKVCVYVQELEVSIDKLNDKSSMTTPPLPSQFPSFSDRFMNEYWMEIDKSMDQKEDNECLICFFEMTHEMDTLKCEECKKVIHMECASKWLKIHRSCPHCRREQLDPNEFPALQ